MDLGAGLLILFTLAAAIFLPQQIENAHIQSDAIEKINNDMDIELMPCRYSAEVYIGEDGISTMQLGVINGLNKSLHHRIRPYTTWTNSEMFNARIENKSLPYWFRSDGATQYGYLNNSRDIMAFLRCV